MFDQDDEVDGMSDASDVEEVDVVDAESTSSSAGDGSGNSDADDTSESSDEGSSGPDNELVAFDAKLAQALGTRPGNEDLNAEDSSSSDEDMDDEQMAALDEHLEMVFRERKKLTSRKKEKEDAKEIIVNFKCRVLELLEIYVKQQHSNSLALSLLVPTLAVIRISTSPLVSSKACSLMREYAKLCKGDGVPKVGDADTTFELLKAVHMEAMKEGSNAYASACSQASLLLVRVLVAHDRECLRRVVRIYGETQEKVLFDSSCKVKTSFFTDWQNWCTSARK
jgi:DNA polymerase phi